MKAKVSFFYVCFCIIFIVLLQYVEIIEAISTNEIVVLHGSSIDNYYKQHEIVLTKINEEVTNLSVDENFNNVAQALQQFNLTVDFLLTDASYKPKVFKNSRSPTILYTYYLYHQQGSVIDTYHGDGNVKSVVQWTLKHFFLPSLKKVESIEEAKSYLDYVDVVFIAHVSPSNTTLLKLLKDMASQYRDLAMFTWIELSANHEDHLEVYRNEDSEIIVSKQSLRDTNMQNVMQFIESECQPLVIKGSAEAFGSIFNKPELYAAWFIGDESDYNNSRKTLQKAALLLRNEHLNIQFVWFPLDYYEEEALRYFGINKENSNTPLLLWSYQNHANLENDILFKTDDIETPEVIVAFGNEFLSNNTSHLQPYRKTSQRVPFDSDDFGRIVTRETFEEGVFHSEKDTLFAVLAPWDYFSSQLEKVLTQFELEAIEHPHIAQRMIMAKIVGSKNDIRDVKGFNYDRYPMLYYIRAGEKIPIRYKGPYTFQAIALFMKEQQLNITQPFYLDYVLNNDVITSN